MIVHAVDAHFTVQESAYVAAYSAAQRAPAAPPVRVASSAPIAVVSPSAHRPGVLSRDQAPCSIQRGYADTNGWGGVIAECDGTVVSVGGLMAWAGPVDSAQPDSAHRVLLRTLDPDLPGSNRLILPSALMLILAAFALFFVARSFKEEPYRG